MLHLFHLLLACVALAAAAPSSKYHEVHCRTEYTTLWDTEYEDIETHECVTKWVPVCKTYTETECSTENRKVCEKTWEGEGDNIKWVDIPGTCEYQPHDECMDVTKEQCTKNAKKMCENKHKRIPVRVSRKVPKKVCDEDDGYTNPNFSIPEYDEYEAVELEATSSGLHKKNKKHSKDSDEDSSDEKKDSDEDSSDEEKERKKHKKHKKHSDEDDD